ncbi:hypothetical protein [Actinoplanes sp. NPDC051494]|uniref:hypothetical protein n=1 Tax=Actinoplanes sp. NPDC051494 TaxID=3363907 RepID=UPI003788EFB8
MSAGTVGRALARLVAGTAVCAAAGVLAYLAVPPHATRLEAAGEQCSSLPADAYHACTAPAVLELIAWAGRGVLTGIVVLGVLFALHPWWIRRRDALVPLDDKAFTALRSELSALAGVHPAGTRPVRAEPTWLLAPYSYADRSRAFGLPWRPFIRLDVGLGILFRTDRARFRSAVGQELDRLRDRSAGTRCLAGGCLLVLTAAAPWAIPAQHRSSTIDACLIGYWTEAPSLRPVLLPDTTVAWAAREAAIWSFTGDGTVTLHLGDESIRPTPPAANTADSTVRAVDYRGAGTIRWRMTTRQGRIELTEPVVEATLTRPGGATRVPDAGEFTFPGGYACRGDTATMPTELDDIELRRVGSAVRRPAGGSG